MADGNGITISQAIDLGKATLENFNQDQLEQTLKHNTYPVINQWFKQDKLELDGGDRVESHIQMRETGNAAQVRMYETDTPNVNNLNEKIYVEWTHAQTSFSYSTKEIAMNRGNKTRIYNLLKSRRDGAYKELADMIEELAWRTPTDSGDDRNPHGIFAWLCQATSDPSEGVGDFTAYTPNYWSDASSLYNAGGLSCSATTNPRWANYYEDHGGKLDDTLLKRLRRSFRKTKFQAPMYANQAIDPKSGFSKFRFYTNGTVLDALESFALKSDDSIGADLGKYAGAVIFKGVPFIYTDILDSAKQYVYGDDPIVGVNHEHFYPVCLKGEYFKVSDPMTKVGQHNVLTVYIDLTYAYICKNRRHAGFLCSNWQTA